MAADALLALFFVFTIAFIPPCGIMTELVKNLVDRRGLIETIRSKGMAGSYPTPRI
jgi:hypothetical protein